MTRTIMNLTVANLGLVLQRWQTTRPCFFLRVDNAIHQINCYILASAVCFGKINLCDSDFSVG